MYNAELECIVEHHGMKLHQFADDCQINTTVVVVDSSAVAARGGSRGAYALGRHKEGGPLSTPIKRNFQRIF
jgi:hypothetical protein